MVKQPAQERQLAFEEVGVVGADAVESGVDAPASDEQRRAEARAASASPQLAGDFQASGFRRVEEASAPEVRHLPEDFESWPGYKVANASARADFENAVLFPGHVFIATGRYVNVQDVSKVYDVMPGEVSPDDVYLLGSNYIAPVPQRDRILRGEVKPAAPARQPNPLRSKDKE